MHSSHIPHFLMSFLSTVWFLLAHPVFLPVFDPLYCAVTAGSRRLADNSAPWRIRHVRLAGKRPRAQESHPVFVKSRVTVLLSPGVHLAGGREQAHVRLHISHRVAPHPAGLLQVGLTLLLHQRSQRRRVG